MSNELHQKMLSHSREDADRGELMRRVWSPTPFMVDAFTGSIGNHNRYREMMEWCREQFGSQCWPIHGDDGVWQCGGATIHGWTWMGFSTLDQLNEFVERWFDDDWRQAQKALRMPE